MAAPAQGKRRSTRQEVDLNAQRPVELRESRRFFSSQGSDRATREARALSQAFGAGTQLASDLIDKGNREGLDRATVDNARGVRDEQDQNFAYNKAWEEMDAERDFNLVAVELKEKLRGADWENLDETQVQKIITDTMANQLEGAENLEHYGRAISPKLVELEAELIGAHRDNVIEQIKTEQSSVIFTNLHTRYEESKGPDGKGVFDYEYLGTQTDTFFNGAEKRERYWASVFDFAITNGRPDIIDDVPERFGDEKSDLTRSMDPLFQEKLRAAKKAAMTKAATMQKEKDDAMVAAADKTRFDIQMEIYRQSSAGNDVSGLIDSLTKVPGTNMAHVTSAKNFGDSQFSEKEQRSPSYAIVGQLYADIHTQKGSASEQMAAVFGAAQAGDLGHGKTGVDSMNALIAKIEQYETQSGALTDQSVAWNRTSLNTRYNDATGGLLKGINPLMQRVKIDANDMYNQLILDGTNATEALNQVIKVFDQQVADMPQIEESEITGRRAQQDFTAKRVTPEAISLAIEQNDVTQFRGIPRYILETKFVTMLNAGEVTEDQLNEFGLIYLQ